jgi:hypothetical protein
VVREGSHADSWLKTNQNNGTTQARRTEYFHFSLWLIDNQKAIIKGRKTYDPVLYPTPG